MAGSEKGGYEVSHKNLFKGMGWIVLEDKASDVYSEEVAQELADMGRALGSRIEFVDIYAHDAYLAMVSHMPHLLASILTQVSGGDELGELRMKLTVHVWLVDYHLCGAKLSMAIVIMLLKALHKLNQKLNMLKRYFHKMTKDKH